MNKAYRYKMQNALRYIQEHEQPVYELDNEWVKRLDDCLVHYQYDYKFRYRLSINDSETLKIYIYFDSLKEKNQFFNNKEKFISQLLAQSFFSQISGKNATIYIRLT